ncbi:MAG: hydrogenase formation protein HypD [Planctomycetota bacterium]
MGVPDRGYRDKGLARRILDRIHATMDGLSAVRLMEVCGTHTVSMGKFGLRRAMPDGLHLLSGPGCPVCVTPGAYIDAAARLAQDGVTVVTFGDMVRVPGRETSLEAARASGGRVVVAGSVTAAVDIARDEGGEVVFLAVGFETTAPTIAAAVRAARAEGLANFSVLVSHKLVPPALRLILDDPRCAVSGFILPGHVSTIIGVAPYQFVAEEYHVPGVVAGFELIDLLAAVDSLVVRIRDGAPAIENGYRRAVRPEGNPTAWAVVEEVFERADTAWRGIGRIPLSGLRLRPAYDEFDAARRYGIDLDEYEVPPGCRCGDVMRGLLPPTGCPLFGDACTPGDPVGPCMVSVEGACAVSHKYGEK